MDGVRGLLVVGGCVWERVQAIKQVCFFELNFGHMAKGGVRHLGRD